MLYINGGRDVKMRTTAHTCARRTLVSDYESASCQLSTADTGRLAEARSLQGLKG
jgi:hypothetical protein